MVPSRRTTALALALVFALAAQRGRADEVGGVSGSSGSGDDDDDVVGGADDDADDDDAASGEYDAGASACLDRGCRGPRTYQSLLHRLTRDYDPSMRPFLAANCTGRAPPEHVYVSFEVRRFVRNTPRVPRGGDGTLDFFQRYFQHAVTRYASFEVAVWFRGPRRAIYISLSLSLSSGARAIYISLSLPAWRVASTRDSGTCASSYEGDLASPLSPSARASRRSKQPLPSRPVVAGRVAFGFVGSFDRSVGRSVCGVCSFCR